MVYTCDSVPLTDAPCPFCSEMGRHRGHCSQSGEEPQGLELDLDSEEEFTQRWRGHTGLASQTTTPEGLTALPLTAPPTPLVLPGWGMRHRTGSQAFSSETFFSRLMSAEGIVG